MDNLTIGCLTYWISYPIGISFDHTKRTVQASTRTKTLRKRCQNGHREVERGHSETTGEAIEKVERPRATLLPGLVGSRPA